MILNTSKFCSKEIFVLGLVYFTWYYGQRDMVAMLYFKYRPFHKTLPRPSAFLNWISVRFYETDSNKKIQV